MPGNDILKKNNPCGIPAGQRCYAVHLPSFMPCAKDRMCTDILEGTLESDYGCKPADGSVQPAMYFLPDRPVENTDAMSAFYHLLNWQAFPSEPEAAVARAALAEAAIAACEAEIGTMRGFL